MHKATALWLILSLQNIFYLTLKVTFFFFLALVLLLNFRMDFCLKRKFQSTRKRKKWNDELFIAKTVFIGWYDIFYFSIFVFRFCLSLWYSSIFWPSRRLGHYSSTVHTFTFIRRYVFSSWQLLLNHICISGSWQRIHNTKKLWNFPLCLNYLINGLFSFFFVFLIKLTVH